MDPRVLVACWLQVDPGMIDLLWVGPNQMITVGPIQVITLTPLRIAVEFGLVALESCGAARPGTARQRLLP